MFAVDIGFIILFFSVPIFCCVLLRTAGLNIFRISIPSFVVVSWFVFAYIGILPLYFRWDAYRDSLGVNDKVMILQVFLYSSISVIGIILGYYLVYQILKNRNNNVIEKRVMNAGILEKLIILLLLACCGFVFYLYIKKVPKIALFVAITESVASSQSARSAMGNSFTGKYHRYDVFIHDILNILSYSLFAYVLTKKNGRKERFITFFFLVSLFFAVFTSIMSTQKGPVAFLIIGYWFIWILVKKNGYMPIKNIFMILFLIFSVLILTYIFFMGTSSPGKALLNVFSRAFSGQIDPAYWYLEYFPDHHDYLMGLSFPNPGSILPFTPFPLTKEIMAWKFPELAARGITGSAPTAFWGEMYANFGIAGILLPPFFVGGYLYLIHYYINKLKSSPFIIGVQVWLILHFMYLAMSGLSSFIFDFKLYVVFIIFSMVVFFSGNGKIKISGRM